jgi:hypothetical protein
MWTKTAPTKAGVYNWRSDWRKEPRRIAVDETGFIVAANMYAVMYGGEWWSEPIQEPSKPKEPK